MFKTSGSGARDLVMYLAANYNARLLPAMCILAGDPNPPKDSKGQT